MTKCEGRESACGPKCRFQRRERRRPGFYRYICTHVRTGRRNCAAPPDKTLPKTKSIMRITLLQTDICWNDARANMAAAGRLMEKNPGADLYVLPEMWATGFVTEPDETTARQGSEALAWMEATARSRRCHVAGSLPVRQDGRFYNRFCLAGPDGLLAHYDKRHLFSYGGEDARYAAGRRRVVTHCCGARLLLLTCYDLRFPVFLRNRGDYDGMICVASWPRSRQAVWDTLLRARALENQCFVAGVNRVGSDPACSYAGGTAWVDAYGRSPQGQPLYDSPGAVSFEPDLERQEAFRKKFPVLADADRFALEL